MNSGKVPYYRQPLVKAVSASDIAYAGCVVLLANESDNIPTKLCGRIYILNRVTNAKLTDPFPNLIMPQQCDLLG